MAGRPKVNHLYTVRITQWINKHDVLWLQISMNKTEALQLGQRRQNLLRNRPDILQRERLELVVFQEIIKVLLKHFEHEAGVVLVFEELESANEVILVCVLLTKAAQDVDFDLTLPCVRRMVLQYFYRDDLARASLPTLHHLSLIHI